MTKFMCIIFTILLVATIALAGEQECSPWLGYCQISDQCCRNLVCLGYQAKCVPRGGLEIPGQDTRPIGPPPYPPKPY